MFLNILYTVTLYVVAIRALQSEPDNHSIAQIRILAVGDSLTAGFCPEENGISFSPYTRKISQLCPVCKTTNVGVTGMLAGAMIGRMQQLYTGENLVIILGGTNDLIRHVTGALIGKTVIDIHKRYNDQNSPADVRILQYR